MSYFYLSSNLTNKYNPQEQKIGISNGDQSSNLTNKYNPQELALLTFSIPLGSNLTNKYNPQELQADIVYNIIGSNLTNKYNPQELRASDRKVSSVQILPINTILKNNGAFAEYADAFKSYQ